MNPSLRTPTAESRASKARRRGLTYGFLAAFFRREPSTDLVESLGTPEVYRSLSQAGMDLGQQACSGPAAKQLAENLVDDYRGLFISPRERIPLNESLYLEDDGCFNGKSTALVGEFIRTAGLKIDDDWTDFPDHISVEFELMKRLADYEADLWDRNDSEAAQMCRARQQTFLKEHIGRWVPQLCNAIEGRAKTRFYAQLARLTKLYIYMDSRDQ